MTVNVLNHLTCKEKLQEEEIVGELQEKEERVAILLQEEEEDGEREEEGTILPTTTTTVKIQENLEPFSSDNSLGTSTTIGSNLNSQNVVPSYLLESSSIERRVDRGVSDMSNSRRVRKLRKLWNRMGKTSMGGTSKLIFHYLDLLEVKVVEGVREVEGAVEEEEEVEVDSLDLVIKVNLLDFFRLLSLLVLLC